MLVADLRNTLDPCKAARIRKHIFVCLGKEDERDHFERFEHVLRTFTPLPIEVKIVAFDLTSLPNAILQVFSAHKKTSTDIFVR